MQIEIKARYNNGDEIASIDDFSHIKTIRMIDTYFNVPDGRLKLREYNGRAELIAYKRVETGLKKSEFFICEVDPAVKTVLSFVLGEIGEVSKIRALFSNGKTRIHIDKVDGLGDFIEIEAPTEDEVKAIMRRLDILDKDLIAKSYIDLLGN